MQLELTKSQFLELMRLTFIGEFVINGHKIDDFDLSSQDFKEFIIKKAVDNGIMKYLDYFSGSKTYDFSHEKSGEFYGLITDYCEENFYTDLVEIVTRNIIYDALDEDTIEKMKPSEYDEIFERTAYVVDKEFQEHDYENLTIKTNK